MYLHMLMLYMLFYNWECPLQNMVFSNFHAIKNEFYCRCRFIFSIRQVIGLNIFKLGMHIEKNGHLNWHSFLCQSLQNFNPIYLKMLYKYY